MSKLPDPVLRLLDDGSAFALDGGPDSDALIVATATLCDQPVVVACVDGRRLAGTLALSHFAQLTALMDEALELQRPLLLFLDTAGVRLQDAARGELGFRHALFAACSFRSRGGSAVSIVPGPMGCFGAGALLALCLGPVLMAEGTRLAVAGPKALEAFGGKMAFDAADKEAVDAHMGAQVRLKSGLISGVLPDNLMQARRAISDAIGEQAVGSVLVAKPWEPTSTYQLPDGQVIPQDDGVIFGTASLDGQEVEFAGVVHGTPLTLDRAARIVHLLDPSSVLPLCLLSDAEQSLDPVDDARGIAKAYANLALRVAVCREAGRPVLAYGISGGTGAAFMVLGMIAESVVLAEAAICSAVPKVVAQALLGDRHALASATARELLEIGAVAALIEPSSRHWAGDMLAAMHSKCRDSLLFTSELEVARAAVRQAIDDRPNLNATTVSDRRS